MRVLGGLCLTTEFYNHGKHRKHGKHGKLIAAGGNRVGESLREKLKENFDKKLNRVLSLTKRIQIYPKY